jgi:hypothetical protein
MDTLMLTPSLYSHSMEFTEYYLCRVLPNVYIKLSQEMPG